MADTQSKKLYDDIERMTIDLSTSLSNSAKEIDKIVGKTKLWEDLTKDIAGHESEISKLLAFQENVTEKINQSNASILALENRRVDIGEELAAIALETITMESEIARLQHDIASGMGDRMVNINALNRLEDKYVSKLDKERSLMDEINGIDTIHLKNAKDMLAFLSSRKTDAEDFQKIEENRLKTLKQMQPLYGSLIKPLLGDSKEFNKSMEFGAKVMKGGSALYLAALDASLERWIELQKAAGEFRNETGLLVTQTELIDSAARSINTEMQNLGVTLKDAYKTADSLYKAFGTTALVTKDMMTSSAQLAANLGLATEDVANFKSTFDSISKSTGNTSDDMIKASVALANMGGVAPSLVLKDMANASGTTLSFLSKSPIQLAKAAVEARRLGTTIEKIASSARGLLNYQESMTAELTASALIGRSISFQNARQLAYEGKIVESRKAALQQIKLAGDFTQLNVWQQDALAKAAQMTVEEITKQQNQEKMLAALKNSANADDRKAAAEYEKMMQSISANEKNAKNDLVARGREMANQQFRQTELNKLTNAFSAIWTSISDALLPIANIIMPIIVGTFKTLAFLIGLVAEPLGIVVSAFTIVHGLLVGIPAILGAIGFTVTSLTTLFGALGVVINTAFWPITLGAIALYGLHKLIKNLSPDIEDSLNEPYENHLKYLEKSPLLGNSPSKVGLSILDGIRSVGPKIEESLKTPFENARNSIEKIPSVESFVSNQDSTRTIQSKIQETVTASVEIVNMDQLPVAINELNAAIDRLSKATSVGSIVNVLTENNSSAGVEEKLDKLTSLLINGAVRTYLDGRKVNSILAK